MKYRTHITFAAILLALVTGFQACSFTKPAVSGADDYLPSQRPIDLNNDAVPFHGKGIGAYHNVDESYCKSLKSTQNVRQEIVKNGSGAWLTVDNCQSVSAKNVTSSIQTDGQDSSILFKNQLLIHRKNDNPFEHARLVCRNPKYPNHHVVIVYENANGLILDQPYYRNTDPDFVPITGIRTQEEGVHKNSGIEYDTVYRSATIADNGTAGQFALFLDHQPSGRIIATWYVQYSGKFRGNNGECVEEPSRYPW